MEWLEAVKALADAPKGEVAKALQEHAGGLYQSIFQKGHDVGYGKKATDAAELQKKLDEALAELGTVKTTLDDTRKGQPDVAKIHEQYQSEIKRRDDALKAEREQFRAEREADVLNRAATDLRANLIAAGVDRDYASVLVEKRDVRSRLGVTKDRGLIVKQAGQEIPIAVADGTDVLDAFAKELVTGIDPKWITSRAEGGSGDKGGSSSPGAGSSNHFAAIREKVAADAKTTQAAQLRGPYAGLASTSK